MKKLYHVLLLTTLAGSAFGSVSWLTTPASAIDNVFWSSLGSDGTTFANNATSTSTLGNVTTIGLGTQPALGGVTSVVCAAVPANCSWPHQTSGYVDGDTLIWLEGLDSNSNPVGTGPLTLTLTSAVFGLGTYIQTTSTGAFNATLDVYNGVSLLGSHPFSSNGAGDPLFLGAQDTLAEITKAVFTITLCGSFGCDVNDFTADNLQIFGAPSAVPEPSTLALSGTLLALGFVVRKRLNRGNK